MGLQHGILGFLNYGPCSGYELTKAFHSSVQFFWPAQTSQIYLTLGKLEDAGLVTHETVIQNGKPNKNVYSILPAGRAELQRWLSEQGKTADGYKSEFLMKVFFAENLPPQQAITMLRAYADGCRAWLRSMDSVPQSIEDYGQADRRQRACILGLYGAVRQKLCADVHRLGRGLHQTAGGNGMRVLVLNGSPKGDKSNTYRLTSAFLDGLRQTQPVEAETIEVGKLHLLPCRGCFACWSKTPGKCVLQDDMAGVIGKILAADVLIWSFPLYYFSIPGQLKLLIDRQLPMSLPFMTDTDSGGHPSRYDRSGQRQVVISTCGFYTAEGNYDAVDAQVSRLLRQGWLYVRLLRTGRAVPRPGAAPAHGCVS